jgi:hypothetical protein
MLTTIKEKLLTLIQLMIVVIYIGFEELIWEGIAKPIYERIYALKILKKLEHFVNTLPPSIILILFIALLVLVETFGIYAGILFVSGNMLLGASLYLSKIPVAAFTFWLFRVTESKLMTFGWFKWMYQKMMAIIGWIKSQEIYRETMEKLHHLRASLKKGIARFKANYLAKESPFVLRMKRLYRTLKKAIKREK